MRYEDCPDIKNHYKSGKEEKLGYCQYLDWAEKKNKTHEQKQCPTCSYWVIWEKRQKVLSVNQNEK